MARPTGPFLPRVQIFGRNTRATVLARTLDNSVLQNRTGAGFSNRRPGACCHPNAKSPGFPGGAADFWKAVGSSKCQLLWASESDHGKTCSGGIGRTNSVNPGRRLDCSRPGIHYRPRRCQSDRDIAPGPVTEETWPRSHPRQIARLPKITVPGQAACHYAPKTRASF